MVDFSGAPRVIARVAVLVEKVAHSRFAASTIIFVLEDDAQDGPDHVDARRSPVWVAGAYVKHNAVVSERYTTVSVIRTIEDLLGLEHLNLHDAGAAPMAGVLDPHQKVWTYTAVVPPILRSESNLPLPPATVAHLAVPRMHSRHSRQWWAHAFAGMDFTREDANNADRLNRILWAGMMGDRPYPATLKP